MGKVYTHRLDASSHRGIMEMNTGKLFAALPIAFFWIFFTFFVVLSLTNLVSHQTNLISWLLVSFIPILFLLILVGTIMLVRHLRSEPGFWTNNMNIKSQHKQKRE